MPRNLKSKKEANSYDYAPSARLLALLSHPSVSHHHSLPLSSLHLQQKVALPAVVIPTVALYDGGGGGHQVRGGAGHARHVQLGELVWKYMKTR